MKKMSLKQKSVTLSAVVIIAALSAYGSIAYFTAEDTAQTVHNGGTVFEVAVWPEKRIKGGVKNVSCTTQ